MVGVVRQSVADVDAALLLVEPIPHVGEPEKELMARLAAVKAPTVLVINKIDTVKKEDLLAVIAAYSQDHQFAAVMPISARQGDGVGDLLDLLEGYLPEGPHLFPEGMVTDQPERQVCGEILREKLLLCLDKEVPHGTAVELTKFSFTFTQVWRNTLVPIKASISSRAMVEIFFSMAPFLPMMMPLWLSFSQ